eukprot:TRINITY_DN1547_c0_g1_i4.p1 TRINITY_DN1547_c0_g1~~TRINITY_DN1547_c0_g1_i4.p1  ORF type:complete len:1227 (+),score=297.00 TRINITY_DN1547_c0_g1_i4:50-3682(+)
MEDGEAPPRTNVDTAANPISRLTFSFLSDLIWRGFRKPLTDKDLYDLDSRDSTQTVLSQFDKQWKAELARYNAEQATTLETEKAKVKKPSVSKSLIRAFGPYFATSWFFHVMSVACSLAQTQILNYLVLFLALPSWYTQQNGRDGYVLALGLALLACVRSLCVYQSQMRSQRTAARMRQSLTSAVYRKAMNISTASRTAASNGQIVNLISNDTQRLVEVFQFLNEGVFAIPQLIICLALLWQQLGPHSLTGFACMLLTVPLSGKASGKMTQARRDMLTHTDRRVKVTSEVLIAIKVVKFYVWERSFMRNVDAVRAEEMKRLVRFLMWRNLMITLVASGPVVMSLISFVTFTSAGNVLLPNVVFTSLALFNLLRIPLTIVPILLGFLAQLVVSMDRFGAFLMEPERLPDQPPNAEAVQVRKSDGESPAVYVRNCEFRWSSDPRPEALAIADLNIVAYPGDVVMVVGSVGSGKSAVVQGIMGDLECSTGDRYLAGRVGYVPQQAWIMNASLRENILFGLPYDEAKYERVCQASALVSDFQMLPGGDMTEIGERGINLSGGQRQRVSIARAAYSDSHVIILDDPLSAVDAHVAQHLFFECFRGVMKDRAIVLCTNQLQFLPHATRVLLVDKRRVVEAGSYDELMAAGGAFAALINSHSSGGAAEEQDNAQAHAPTEVGANARLVQDEGKESGLVPWTCYIKYFRAGHWALFALLIFFFALENTGLAISFWWLAQWSTYLITNPVEALASTNVLLSIYAGISSGVLVCTIGRNFSVAFFNAQASRNLHIRLLASVLRFPQYFFDTTPLGRILNRFTKDLDTIDLQLPQALQIMFVTIFMVVATAIVVAVIQPIMTAVVVPLAVLLYLLSRFSRYSTVELQRLESVARSPIYAQLSETLSGVTTIRAFGQSGRLLRVFVGRCDQQNRAFLILQTAIQWLGVRLDFLGYVLLFVTAVLLVVHRGQTSPGLAGFVLTQVLQILNYLNRLATQIADVETKMNSIERIEEYVDMPHEPVEHILATFPTAAWPSKGKIEFDNVSMRYREGLPLVLHNVSLQINPGEKVGVVGRTGAGKSSVMLLLFRIVEAMPDGRVLIDDVDIAQLGVADLRKNLAIIPQEPFLFSGTIRQNLDPFDEFEDERLWDTLKQVRLVDDIRAKELGLLCVVQEGGENFSVGQRQLICLGRALLRGAQILLMDEATASVDVETGRKHSFISSL